MTTMTLKNRVAAVGLAAAVTLLLAGCHSSSSSPEPVTIIEANIDTQATQVGGATQAVALYNDGTLDWTLYSMANRFAATPVGMTRGAVTEITVPGWDGRTSAVPVVPPGARLVGYVRKG